MIQVDQSVKIEDTAHDSVLALANDVSWAVLLPAAAKRRCLQVLRRYGEQDRTIVLRVFAAALFLLLEHHLQEGELCCVGTEYTGHEDSIRAMVANWIRRQRRGFAAGSILFAPIGKDSPAHKRAIRVVRGQERADQVLTAGQVLRLLR